MLARRLSATKPSYTSGLRCLSYRVPSPFGETTLDYKPGSPEVKPLLDALKEVRSGPVEVPCVVNGEKIYTGKIEKQVIPSDHGVVIAHVHQATEEVARKAVEAADKARYEWDSTPLNHRISVFRAAADLIVHRHRARVNAVTMLGTGKTIRQAEIDCIQEQADFLRLNCNFAEEIYNQQPILNTKGSWNRLSYRGLEGFVAAISPFNFCAIGTNLNTAPAVMGSTTVWKPSHSATLENYVCFQILEEAGLPPGVINFLPSTPDMFQNVVLTDRRLAGLHFTGSTNTFRHLWSHIGNNITNYQGYPRMVGETGGKNFHLIHPSADIDSVLSQTVRSAFEYQGQKCSACSRLYMPKSMWESGKQGKGLRERMVEVVKGLSMGQPDDLSNFMSAVIDEKAVSKHRKYIDAIKNTTQGNEGKESKILVGGKIDDERGYFVSPTIIETTNPKSPTMTDELFGPILTVYVYDDSKANYWSDVLSLVDSTSPYGLTGAVFSQDRYALVAAEKTLRHSAGNLYFNDKSTGAVVGEQPFGGARLSGTNDKAGAALNLYRWTSAQVIKETYVPLGDHEYPHMKKN